MTPHWPTSYDEGCQLLETYGGRDRLVSLVEHLTVTSCCPGHCQVDVKRGGQLLAEYLPGLITIHHPWVFGPREVENLFNRLLPRGWRVVEAMWTREYSVIRHQARRAKWYVGTWAHLLLDEHAIHAAPRGEPPPADALRQWADDNRRFNELLMGRAATRIERAAPSRPRA